MTNSLSHILPSPCLLPTSKTTIVNVSGWSPLALKIAILEYHFPFIIPYELSFPSYPSHPSPCPHLFIALLLERVVTCDFFYSVNRDCLTFHVKYKSYIFIGKDTYTFMHKLNHITVI